MKEIKKSKEDFFWSILEGVIICLTVLYIQPVVLVTNMFFKDASESFEKEEIASSWGNVIVGIAGILLGWFLSTVLLYIVGTLLWGFSKIIWIVAKEIFNVLAVVFV